MNNSAFEDITLKVDGDTELRCNKFVLCARSEVFRAMFSHPGLKEAKEGLVEIKDADVTTVKDLLEFVYSDNVKDICMEVMSG